MNDCPKILVISNNSFSKSNSNGRTLANFFINWDKNRLAQFFIIEDIPDFNICKNYYKVTDSDAIKAFKTGINVGERVTTTIKTNTNYMVNKNSNKKITKTPLTSIIRDLIWKSKRWKNEEINQWINNFNPNLILVQAGDAPFMLKFAREIALKRNIPIIIYNTENYYFKDKNYMKSSILSNIIYPVFIRILRREYKKIMQCASISIYNSDMLRKVYDEEFNKASMTIMTSTEIKLDDIEFNEINDDDEVVISYLGNLGVGRHESLIEIAETLQKIDKKYKIDIYGLCPSNEIKDKLLTSKGISYKGYVTYKEVKKVVTKSDLLIHAENFSDFYKWDLQYGFSTKIADSLASGSCFFIYAPKTLACTEYLIKNDCACIVTDKNDLEKKLLDIIKNKEKRSYYIKNALQVAEKYHNIQVNCDKIRNVINEVVKTYENTSN